MINILYVVITLKRSGPINILSNIIKGLDRRTFKPFVITLSPETSDSLVSYFHNNLEAKVTFLNKSRLGGIFKANGFVEKFIIENNIKIVHGHGFSPPYS